MKNKAFIHIGFPKTATTTLQKNIFPIIPDLEYLGLYDRDDTELNKYSVSEDIIEQIIKMPHIEFKIKTKPLANKGKDILFSEENIITETLIPTSKNISLSKRTQDLTSSLRNIIYYFKNYETHVILSTRKQTELIPSFYAQHYYKRFRHISETNTLSKYIEYILATPEYASLYDYDIIYSLLCEMLDKEQAHLLPMELIKENNRYIKTIEDIFNRRVNDIKVEKQNARRTNGFHYSDNPYNLERLLKKTTHRNKRLSNSLLRKIGLPKYFTPKFKLTNSEIESIKILYNESNRSLKLKTSEALENLNYYEET